MTYDDWKLATPDEYESPAPRSDDLGDETEICGCDEAVALRARVAELEASAVRDVAVLRMAIGEPGAPDIIYVFREDGRTLCTSYHDDPAWDTVENRRRTFEFITRHDPGPDPTLLDQVRAVVAIWEDAMARDRCDTGNARMTDIADVLRGAQ